MPDRPNIVVVLCDRLRRQALGCYGNDQVETPNIDRLAGEGVRFENACSTYPVCVPARFTLMTGEYPHTRFAPNIDWRMSPAEDTIADELGAEGYDTAYFGKWHLAGFHRFLHVDWPETNIRMSRTPVPRDLQGGFDTWRGWELRNDPFDTVFYENDDRTMRRREGYQTDVLTDMAIDYVRDEGDEPFFLTVSIEPPHPPFTAPTEYLQRWRGRDIETRPNVHVADGVSVLDRANHAGVAGPRTDLDMRDGFLDDVRAYYAQVENVDDNVGRLLSTLDSEGIRDDTAVVFLADHGELLGSHGDVTGGPYEMSHPYEESIGMPFIVSWPGGIEGGRVVEAPTCSEDWYPTLLGLAGLEAGEKPGTDLAGVVRGDHGLDRRGVMLTWVRDWIEGHRFSDEVWRGFRTERYKYTVKGGPYGGRPWQLFDLQADPYEQENLLHDPGPETEQVARDLHGSLRARMAETDDLFPLTEAWGYDALNAWWERPGPHE